MIIIIINSNQLTKAMNIIMKNWPAFKWQANIAVKWQANTAYICNEQEGILLKI